MGEFAHFGNSDSEDGDSSVPSMLLVDPPDRRQSTYSKQEVFGFT